MSVINSLYFEDIKTIINLNCEWSELRNKTFLIAGGTGLIGTYIKDMLLYLNNTYSLNLLIIVLTRKEIISEEKSVVYYKHNVVDQLLIEQPIDYIIHAASNTHPFLYSTEPVETITTNFVGTKNLLDLTVKNPNCRFLFLSSVEIYGEDINPENKGFSETDFGYLDCNTLRAGYCESKRASESLCQAYGSQYNVDFVIARLCRCYGPTLRNDDTKALSQFLRNGILNENIVLKSSGTQYYSYLYASDAAAALIFLLLNGKNKEAYNIADTNSNISLKDLCKLIADYCNVDIVYDVPNEIEKKGFSKATRAILNSSKINQIGWKPVYTISEGIKRTVDILKQKS